jgi:hypothetical protein
VLHVPPISFSLLWSYKYIWWEVYIFKLPITCIFQFLITFILLDQNILLGGTLFLNTPISTLSVGDQVSSQKYQRRGKIIVLYTSIVTVSDS